MKKPSLSTGLLKQQVKKLIGFVTKYKGTILFVIFGLTVGFAFYRAQTYSDPPRDEAFYNEQLQQHQSINIDTKLLENIKASVDDQDTDVSQSTQPGRTNPFSE